MRKTHFGDYVIESKDDDLGKAIMEFEDEMYAVVRPGDDPDTFYFDVLGSNDGEEVASSEPIFTSFEDARTYLKDWVPDVQRG